MDYGSNLKDGKHSLEKYSCNGTIVEHPEYGEVMQLSGDQRQQIKDFLVNVGIVKEENCKVHGF
ncbi:putative translation initiation factor SUI1 [Ancylostoma duodenale]|uniref:Putative translation initiation factor SUI1 n=1 Tax=Ancylostoma duodenale TaxID=51022 RepID=A0A0C2GLA7_9BILA|nr:putative translation initiation factor SUI1 [Ancylostoma duodenale]